MQCSTISSCHLLNLFARYITFRNNNERIYLILVSQHTIPSTSLAAYSIRKQLLHGTYVYIRLTWGDKTPSSPRKYTFSPVFEGCQRIKMILRLLIRLSLTGPVQKWKFAIKQASVSEAGQLWRFCTWITTPVAEKIGCCHVNRQHGMGHRSDGIFPLLFS